MADERLEPPRQQSSYFAPVASNPNPDSTPSSNTASNNASTANIAAPPAAEPRHRFRPLRTLQPRQSNIRIRRAPAPRPDPNNPSNPYHVRSMLDVDGNHQPQDQQSIHLRRLSGGSPIPGDHRNAHPLQQQQQPGRSMLDVEDNTGPDGNTQATDFGGAGPGMPPERKGLFHRFSRATMRPDAANNQRRQQQQQLAQQGEYDSNIVDMLDVVDPEVSTLSSITNVQNSLFVPSLGRWVNRRPTYNLTRYSDLPGGAFPSGDGGGVANPSGRHPPETRQQGAPRPGGPDRPLKDVEEEDETPGRPSVERIPSYMTERFYAVRPQDTSLAEWSDEDLAELNDHVRHMLHSKRSAFKRSMKAFGQYVRRPLGFAVTLYAFLITVFGFAWVLFLIGWVYLGDEERRDYIIDVIDNVLVALFAVVGDGMIPWRLVDTYHMCFIARYYHLTWKLRNKMHVPELKDHNDLPSEPVISHRTEQEDIEAQRDIHMKQSEEHSVLSPTQQAKLEHHQACFSKSHTFYKPHETETHYAFPLRLLVAIVVLLDFHSCFQLALGLCTWLIDYHVRPAALTATILSCSIAVNITAGSPGRRREEEERNRLENIDEESPGAKSRGASVDLGERLKQTLKRKNSDEDKTRSSKSLDIARKPRKSNDIARKPVNHVGMFDSSITGGLAEEEDGGYFSDPKADTKPDSNPTGPSTEK
ncbi:hypothetical protein PG991_007051 [Apiospora marii]|uniref:Integral membrane protein n=1 Tax=Apiospora marii TaxID=335849 RepID=A0ABR1RZ22_9PEZI